MIVFERYPKNKETIKAILTIASLFLLFFSCSSMRTEVFRNETKHLYMQGNTAYQSGEYDQAADFYVQVIKLDPGYARAHVGLGNVALLNKDFAKAKKHYQRAVDLEPKLKHKVMALLSEASVRAGSGPLKKCGLDLQKVCKLIDAGKFKALDKLLSQDVPLELLAKDTGSILLADLAGCRDQIGKRVQEGDGSTAFMFFAGYALSVADGKAYIAARAFEQAAASGSKEEKKKAFLALAELYERMDNKNRAVDTYLKAVAAGVSLEAVAKDLAELYGLPVEVITGEKEIEAGDK